MRDPSVMQVLRDMQENPTAGQAALKDPVIMAKIQKLIAAGVLKMAWKKRKHLKIRLELGRIY